MAQPHNIRGDGVLRSGAAPAGRATREKSQGDLAASIAANKDIARHDPLFATEENLHFDYQFCVAFLITAKECRLNRVQYRFRVYDVQVMYCIGAIDRKEQPPVLILSDKGIELSMLSWKDV
jgi:hypothetical protein